METVIAQLDQLADYRSKRDVLALDKQSLIDGILTPEIKAKIAEIEAEFSPKFQDVDANCAALEGEIKKNVLLSGTSVKGTHLQAVWAKGRSKWDEAGLKGYAKAHPEVLDFYTQGEPSVSIRTITSK